MDTRHIRSTTLLLALATALAPGRAAVAVQDEGGAGGDGDDGADDGQDDEPVAEGFTERVEIIATADATEDPAATVDRVTRADIEASGARTASDALRLVPGVTIDVGGRGEAGLQVRGFDTRQVQVLVDGVPLGNPYDGGLDLAAISASQIDQIRVGRGAAGSAYGGGALGGVVDIRTAGAPDSRTARVRAGGGSSENGELLAAGGGAVGPVRVGVAWELRGRPHVRMPASFPARPNEGGGWRDNSDRRDTTLHGSIGVGDGGRSLELRATVMDVRRGVPPHIDDPSPRYWRWDLWRDQLFSLHGRTPLGARVALRGAAYARFRGDTLDSYDDATYATQEGGTAWSSSYRDRSGGGMLSGDVDLGRGSMLETTLSYRHDLHRSQADTGEPWESQQGDTGTASAGARVRLAPPLVGQLGVDAHLWQPRDQAETLHRNPVFAADPRAGLVWTPVEDLSLRLSGGRRSRFPTLKEMYTTQFGFVVPNPDLQPETAWTVDGGISAALMDRRLVLAVTGFFAHVAGLIERTYDADGNRRYTNVSTSRHLGAEARLIARPHPSLELELGYDWLHARNTSADRLADLLEYRPEHRGRARVHLRAPFGLSADAVLTVVSPRHYVAVEATGEMGVLPAYARLDASLRQELGRGFSLFAVGTNLTDALYETEQGYPAPGVEILGGLEFAGTAPRVEEET